MRPSHKRFEGAWPNLVKERLHQSLFLFKERSMSPFVFGLLLFVKDQWTHQLRLSHRGYLLDGVSSAVLSGDNFYENYKKTKLSSWELSFWGQKAASGRLLDIGLVVCTWWSEDSSIDPTTFPAFTSSITGDGLRVPETSKQLTQQQAWRLPGHHLWHLLWSLCQVTLLRLTRHWGEKGTFSILRCWSRKVGEQ